MWTIGLTNTFVWKHLMEKPKWTFWPTQYFDPWPHLGTFYFASPLIHQTCTRPTQCLLISYHGLSSELYAFTWHLLGPGQDLSSPEFPSRAAWYTLLGMGVLALQLPLYLRGILSHSTNLWALQIQVYILHFLHFRHAPTIWRSTQFWCLMWSNGQASQLALVIKNPPVNAGDIRDVGIIPGSERSPGGVHDNPQWPQPMTIQYILSWRIPWAEEPGGLQSTGSQRVGHNRSDLVYMHTCGTMENPLNSILTTE